MKNSEQNQLAQILKDKLSEGTAQVPDFIWPRIEEELFPKKKRRGFFWWFFGGFCISLITVLIVIAVLDPQVQSQSKMQLNSNFNPPGYRLQNDEKSQQKTAGVLLNSTKKQKDSSDRTDVLLNREVKLLNSTASPANPPSSTRYGSKMNSLSDDGQKFHAGKKRKSSVKTSTNGALKRRMHYSSGKTEQTLSYENLHSGGSDKITLQNALWKKPVAEGNQEETVINAQPKSDSGGEKELSYEEMVELVNRDFRKTEVNQAEKNNLSFFSIGVVGGPSLYNSAVFKDYFTSGQLSQRTFTSSGFELGLQFRFKVSDRFKIYAGLTFNQKQTQFSYNLAITQADYFTYVVNGEKVPLENIRDNGLNSCFLAQDVTAKYQIQAALISLGTRFEFLRSRKFSVAADIRLSGNMHASLKLKEIRTLDIIQPQSEKFSYIQPGAGISLDYRLNKHISIGLTPFFSKQFYLKESFSHKMDELVIPISVSFTP